MATETKWTPGPWKVGGYSMAGESKHFRHNDGDFIVAPVEGDEELGPVARIHFKGKAKRGEAYKTDDPIGLANANLISAAPELYEALNALIQTDGEVYSISLRGRANAALAKARGEQP